MLVFPDVVLNVLKIDDFHLVYPFKIYLILPHVGIH